MNRQAGQNLTQASGSDVCLLCRAGSLLCAIPLEHVSETMRPLPVSPVAGMPSFLLGLSVLRGSPVPVVDAARLLGAAIVASRPGRFVSLRLGRRQAALAVDGVIGIRALTRESLEAVPPLLADASCEMVEVLGSLDAELLVVLRSGRIVPDSLWTALHAQGTS
jgi:purine-binding chemotaxis protein CheW